MKKPILTLALLYACIMAGFVIYQMSVPVQVTARVLDKVPGKKSQYIVKKSYHRGADTVYTAIDTLTITSWNNLDR